MHLHVHMMSKGHQAHILDPRKRQRKSREFKKAIAKKDATLEYLGEIQKADTFVVDEQKAAQQRGRLGHASDWDPGSWQRHVPARRRARLLRKATRTCMSTSVAILVHST